MSLVALDHQTHAALTFQSVDDYTFAAASNLVPLLAFEVGEAARHFPIMFPASNAPNPHALLGLGKGNAFVNAEGRWTGAYLPLTLANHPFSLFAPAQSQAGKDADATTEPRLALVIEDSAPHFRQSEGAALFTKGEPTEVTQRIATVLQAQYRRHQSLVPLLEELHRSGVLREQSLTLERAGKSRTIKGLRVAEREAVLALPDATLARWARNGLLELIHQHWKSLNHLPALLDALEEPGHTLQ